MSNARRAFNVDAKTKELLETEVTIGGAVYHPVPITTDEARTIKKLVRKIRRAGRQADVANNRVEEAEKAAAEADTPEASDEHFAKADQWQDKVDEYEALAELHTHELLAAELINDAGEHPAASDIARHVPAQLQKDLFEFLAGETDEADDEAEADPQSQKSTASTSA